MRNFGFFFPKVSDLLFQIYQSFFTLNFGLNLENIKKIDPAVAEAFDGGLVETLDTEALNGVVEAVLKASEKRPV